MSVEFDEPKYSFDRSMQNEPPKGAPIMNLIIKYRLAKSPAQANVVMIIICLICLIAAFIIVKSVI